MGKVYEDKGKLDKAAVNTDLEWVELNYLAKQLEVEKFYSRELRKILVNVITED